MNRMVAVRTVVAFGNVFLIAACADRTVDEGGIVETSPEALRAARQTEVTNWLKRGHDRQHHAIVRTDTLPDGTVVDWVARPTVAGADRPPPPAPRSLRFSPVTPPSTADDLHGPPDALPFIRPALSPYISGEVPAASVEEYLSRLPQGNPNAQNSRLYGALLYTRPNYGLVAAVNNNWGQGGSNLPSSPDFSISELASYCAPEIIGAIVGYIPQLNSGFRFYVEYPNASVARYVSTPPQAAWHQNSATKAPNMPLTGVSQSGQANGQVEHVISVELWNDGPFFGLTGNDWWIYLDNEYVGFINADQAGFHSLNSSGCGAQWYGEVWDPDQSTTHWTSADNGSGLLPTGSTFAANWTTRAYIRNPGFYSTLMTIQDGSGGFTKATTSNGAFLISGGTGSGYDPNCYGRLLTTDGPSAFQPTLFFGGPGGDNPGCN